MFENAFHDGTLVRTSCNFNKVLPISVNVHSLNVQKNVYTHVKSCIVKVYGASGTIDTRKRNSTIDKAFTYFLFFLFIYQQPVHIQPRAEVAQRGMKARHQFKKSTPSVVAGKNAAPWGGGWPAEILAKAISNGRLVTCRISIIIKVFCLVV